ncbi:MAG: ABC transporter permease [Gemmatimonadota bacterium]
MTANGSPPRVSVDGGRVVVDVSGMWSLEAGIPSAGAVEEALAETPTPSAIRYEGGDLGAWDASLLTYLVRVGSLAREAGVSEDRGGLPEGVRGMLALAEAVPPRTQVRRHGDSQQIVTQIGLTTIEVTRDFGAVLEYTGEVVLSMGRLLRGKASFRGADLWLAVQKAGVEAMPIVALVSFLLGVILAFVGAIQLERFGAAIYVADLVGIAMVRDMAALMTGIVMAGRSGAAYAAEIGAMQGNEEIDALTTAGISPIDFVVLPRVLALILMMPLLTVYADFVSILGGMFVGVTMLDQTLVAYMVQTTNAVDLTHLVPGIFKGTVYGAIVALSGCLRGLQAGRSSLAVGAAATSAVVTAIVMIIAAAGVFSVLSYVLGI